MTIIARHNMAQVYRLIEDQASINKMLQLSLCAKQAGRARRAKRDGNPICSRRAFLACLARHAPRS